VHLATGVVEVVLALDVVAGRLQDIRQSVTQRGVASVPDVQGSGWVGGDEFDLDALSGALGSVAEPIPLHEDVDECVVEPPGLEVQVDETGASDLDVIDEAWFVKM